LLLQVRVDRAIRVADAEHGFGQSRISSVTPSSPYWATRLSLAASSSASLSASSSVAPSAVSTASVKRPDHFQFETKTAGLMRPADLRD